jgi:uncharacterized protein DUF4189
VAAVCALLLIVAGGGFFAFLIAGDDEDDPESEPVAAAPSWQPEVTTAPSFTLPPRPSLTPFSPPSTYSPPVRLHYGAIAVAPDGSVGKSWDFSTRAGAERRALNECPRSGCKVLVTFVNSCGAIAYNSATRRYWGGRGTTRTAAQRDAISNAGGGRWITWVCTTRPA